MIESDKRKECQSSWGFITYDSFQVKLYVKKRVITYFPITQKKK